MVNTEVTYETKLDTLNLLNMELSLTLSKELIAESGWQSFTNG